MRIALHDADKTSFPNLALMKLSAWHKKNGGSVEWWNPLEQYDLVYSSKVFTFTQEDPYLPDDTIKGGTGYGNMKELPAGVDRCFPDYSIYPNVDYAIGYLTRGCIRNCPWCIVPKKEGRMRTYRCWQEIARPGKRDIVFMDNNVLASDHGIEQMADMIGKGVRVDFNQGLDARLITQEVAEIISRLKWIQFIRMAADTEEMLGTVIDRIMMLKEKGVKPYRIFVYVLAKDIPSAERRCLALREVGANPFAQPYRDFENRVEPSAELKRFARWVNCKEIFKASKNFAEYNTAIRGKGARA